MVSAAATILLAPGIAQAYVGPGAGFALLSSFFVLLVTLVLALVSLLLWPFRTVWRWFRRRRLPRPAIRRLVIVGFDGQDPRITERMLADGELPHFRRLMERGSYRRLRTSIPSVSPVAWSSFSTGTHPGKHRIFDFLARDPRSYLPVLSSARIGAVRRFLALGRYRIPLQRPELTLLRRSIPFWSILGRHGIWSTVIRVPITFPPDRFYGAQLSAMSVPDILGTQGTFLLYTTRPAATAFKEGGMRVFLPQGPTHFETTIRGPENAFRRDGAFLETPLVIDLHRPPGKVTVTLDTVTVELTPGSLSDWLAVRFSVAPGLSVSAICRMMVTELGDHFSLYLTPLNIDPESPAMPISHPAFYATYLAKRIGPYATLGLAEDTWGVNEKVIDHDTFLAMSSDIDDERQRMLFTALDRLRRGALVCVFDATDRVQHMFWRYHEDGEKGTANDTGQRFSSVIEDQYRRNDALVGRVLDRLGAEDLLMVLSDHGFTSFRRGVNLNAWLLRNGYLSLKPGRDGRAEWLRDVDWSRTRAYALGLAGMYLNVKGREGQGIVEPGAESAALVEELAALLTGLMDEELETVAIRTIYPAAATYSGPYRTEAPDLVIGYNHGYRASWDGATGVVATEIFEDNTKAWSGDHCVDPDLVPGVLFSSRRIDRDDPQLADIAPTVLSLFGIEPPPHLDGRALLDPRAFTRETKR